MDQPVDAQRTEEWFKARCGMATASKFKDILAKTKTGASTSRLNYCTQIVTERLTGLPSGSFSNSATTWGTEQEPLARDAYRIKTSNIVEEVGFIRHETLMAGASPDGLIDWDGLIEIKCPYNSTVHINTLLNGVPTEHIPQIQGQLWITGRDWCDFVSFDPRLPENLRLFISRVQRDEVYIKVLASEVIGFLEEVNKLAARLESRNE